MTSSNTPTNTRPTLKIYASDCLGSKELLDQVLTRHHVKDKRLRYGTNGKPYLKSGELYFSISHSAGRTICAVADQEIGADIQKIAYRPRVARRICQDHELAEANSPAGFTRLWALKESFVKANGAGLAYGLKNIDSHKLKTAKCWRLDDFFIAICYNRT